MNIINIIQEGVSKAVNALYESEINSEKVSISETRKEFKGDFTVVTFPFTKIAKKKPEEIGQEIGDYLVREIDELKDYNIIKGFLNLEVHDSYWKGFLDEASQKENYGQQESTGRKVMVEFSSPNTNKPLHLGHIRNILLGWSCSQILDYAGFEVIKVQILNDRGVAVCKSMYAWKAFGNNETPESSGMKGDQLVGKYYVLFQQKLNEEYTAWQQTSEAKTVYTEKKRENQSESEFFKKYDKEYFNENSVLGQAVKDMLIKWEANDPKVRALWKQMNDWVYDGYDLTYKDMGVSFDKLYYESDTYLLGKDMIEKGLEKEILQQDGKRVFVDLEEVKLGVKTVIKSDGTSTYTSQDLGTAKLRYEDFGMEKVVYVVGDEQISHFKVLFEILKRLGEPYADGLYHLAYGMIDLPTGKMKSREGTIVDADDLIAEVIAEARSSSVERGDLDDLPEAIRDDIYRKIGLAALKYFILKVNPQKRMVFNPQESVDLHGDTGPYIQNAYVRIKSVLRKADQSDLSEAKDYTALESTERDLIALIYKFPEVISNAATQLDPSFMAAFSFDLAKVYHKFYHDCKIITAETPEAKAFRLQLSTMVAQVLSKSMELLGIEMPERM